jgi:polysaccharide biosynthesis protein PslH
MKILQLCKKFPFPLNDGESIAVTYLTKAMKSLGAEVTLLAMNTSKHFVKIEDLPADFDHYKAIHTSYLDNKVSVLGAIKNLFTKDSYHVSRYINGSFSDKLVKLLQENQFDVIQLETLFLAPYTDLIRKYSKAKIVMRSHNVEHEIWRRMTDNTSNFLKKKYLKLLSNRLEKFEIEKLNTYDALLAITERDLAFHKKMGYQKVALTVPIGIDTTFYRSKAKAFQSKLSIGFIGTLDWQPNEEGVKWFLGQIWPQLSIEFPELEFHIAGRNAPDWIKNLVQKNVFIHGNVPEALDFINEHNIMVVPLLSGGGMRVKIVEGMALGRVILSTAIGIEGINIEHKKEAFIAENATDFVESIRFCYQKADKLNKIGQLAQQFTKENYDNIEIGKKVLHFYEDLIR